MHPSDEMTHSDEAEKHTPTPVPTLEHQMLEALTNPQQEMPSDRAPTIEEVASAIRKLTGEIESREKLRTGLRAKLRKMAGEI